MACTLKKLWFWRKLKENGPEMTRNKKGNCATYPLMQWMDFKKARSERSAVSLGTQQGREEASSGESKKFSCICRWWENT